MKDLREFIAVLEREGQLKRISAPVSAELEITEIADRVVKRKGPALLFENVVGSDYPVLINAFGSQRRMSLALGDNLDKLLELDMSNLLKLVPSATRVFSAPPSRVLKASCQEIAEEPNLDKLPILKCWPGDGGRFVTLPLVFTRDPDSGAQNMGMYRLQVYDAKTTGMHWHLHKDGHEIYEKYRKRGLSRMPVSVAIGCDPATVYAATAPLPKMIDELLFAGFLRRRPVPVVKCLTNEIRVPADAEFVLEGYVNIGELREEGPFGDHTGYYSERGMYPVFHVEKLTRRKNPVYMATIVGRPPMEDCFLAKATERIFLPLLRMIAPEIRDISFPLEGVFHNCVIVAIDKKYPAHAKKVMNTVWGLGQMMYTKTVIVVDADVSPHDYSAVAWKAFNNIDARRDLVISDGPLDALDHASPLKHQGARLGIDATKKWIEECPRPFPDDIVMSGDIKRQVSERWREYGF
ncbi:menaquinone biosynthesis decarboxylase [Clostridia bacterium]|nr:menaquinone biosynthesis decarboxylase [Clostridia bacterium]